jgi:hypothetical protein
MRLFMLPVMVAFASACSQQARDIATARAVFRAERPGEELREPAQVLDHAGGLSLVRLGEHCVVFKTAGGYIKDAAVRPCTGLRALKQYNDWPPATDVERAERAARDAVGKARKAEAPDLIATVNEQSGARYLVNVTGEVGLACVTVNGSVAVEVADPCVDVGGLKKRAGWPQ